MKKKTLSKKEIRELNDRVASWGLTFDKKSLVEEIHDEPHRIQCDGRAVAFFLGDDLVPSLKLLLKGEISLKTIIVDMGAVRFVCNGADIMRPGITNIDDDIVKDEIIAIVDIDNKKPLAVGKAMIDAQDMREATGGKVIKNLHYVGDSLWSS